MSDIPEDARKIGNDWFAEGDVRAEMLAKHVASAIHAAVKAENERCAQIVESEAQRLSDCSVGYASEAIAAAIRSGKP